MRFQHLLLETWERTLTITINRPEKLNALNSSVLSELETALLEARNSAEVDAVVLTGAGGKAFVAGADIQELARLTPRGGAEYARRGQRVFDLIETLGKPVIAAIDGYALGGGCELAMACTLRIASENSRLGQPEVKLGIIPGYGGSQRLARLVGKGRALQLCLTGEQIDAREAHRIGLVNQVVAAGSALGAARDMARAILGNGPVACAYVMEAIHRGLEMPLEQGLFLEAALFGLCAASSDMHEGMTAFLEKRRPNFQGK